MLLHKRKKIYKKMEYIELHWRKIWSKDSFKSTQFWSKFGYVSAAHQSLALSAQLRAGKHKQSLTQIKANLCSSGGQPNYGHQL